MRSAYRKDAKKFLSILVDRSLVIETVGWRVRRKVPCCQLSRARCPLARAHKIVPCRTCHGIFEHEARRIGKCRETGLEIGYGLGAETLVFGGAQSADRGIAPPHVPLNISFRGRKRVHDV